MGHGQKNANRGEAIARNTERVRTLAKKIEDLAKLSAKGLEERKEEFEAIVEQLDEFEISLAAEFRKVNDRLDLLERSVWRKIVDKAKDIVSGGDPANPKNRAVQLDIHSVRHEAHSRIIKTEEKKKEKDDAGNKAESGDA